ncbi:hypothetical protein QQS21_012549 [Conoideocrella luteorostrata]|uniref:NACHT domain-containing protein n=1 Tax=Conoideocrella luteorostrata TaxID=1105319 RepID=A0AAJ0CAZ4_9HYPO|nr:hypothetical protein QQS21_012549 [Conoideocrella luteorostrata]
MSVPALKIVYNHPDSEIDIVAVHGLASTSVGSWTWKSPDDETKQVQWLSDRHMLPSFVPKSRILIFDFASKWAGNAPKQRLTLLGQELLDVLYQLRESEQTPDRRIMFIGHSFGGIVIEQALVLASASDSRYSRLLLPTVGVIFLGTPHRGTKSQIWATRAAKLFDMIGFGSHQDILIDLAENSPRLRDLLREFCIVANRLRLNIFCFFELLQSDMAGKLGSYFSYKEMVVSEYSACIDCFPSKGLNVDHFKLNKFPDAEDRNFRSVASEIQKIVEQNKDPVTRRRHPIEIVQDRSAFDAQKPEGKGFIQKLMLKATDPIIDKKEIERKKGGVVNGTCRWILCTREYTMWLNGIRIAGSSSHPQSQLLWLHGDAGRGKTHLSCFVIDQISHFIERSDDPLLITYFFCDATNTKRNTAAGVIRSLILQLLRQNPRLFSHVSAQFEEQGERLIQSFDALWASFLEMVRDSGVKCTYCVIDGIDEMKQDARSTILTAFSGSINPSRRPRKIEDGGSLRVLMASRPHTDIEEHLSTFPSISLSSDETSFGDIAIFVESKVKDLKARKKYPRSTTKFITQELTSRAEGTFLWVALACEELNKVSSVEAKRTIRHIPSGLPKVYQSILEQVSDENLGIVKKILGWVFVAFRPLLLEELHVACNVAEELGDGEDEIQFTIDCIGFCGSLISIQKTHFGDTVQLIHQSARDYLTERLSPNDKFYVDIAAMHTMVSNRCLKVINDYFSPRSKRNQTFFDYSARYVMHHARHADKDQSQGFDTRNPFFYENSDNSKAWLQYQQKLKGFVDSRTLTEFSSLHIASRWGVFALAKYLLSRGQQKSRHLLAQRDGWGATPLYYAAEKRFYEIAKLFIDEGADIHARGGVLGNILQAAAAGGDERIVDLLLSKDVDIDAEGGRYCSALQAAAAEGHKQIVERLLATGANVNLPHGGVFSSALQAAAAGGYIEIVELLLANGADVNCIGGRFVTALQAASAQGHTATVELLLEHNADVQAGGKRDSFWTFDFSQGDNYANNDSRHGFALQAAACRGHFQIVEILCQHGADVDAIDDYYGNALQAAATGGNVQIVDFIANRTLGINSEAGHYGFALQAAAALGHLQVVKLLVAKGADVRSSGGHYITALKAAQRCGHADIELFLQAQESAS